MVEHRRAIMLSTAAALAAVVFFSTIADFLPCGDALHRAVGWVGLAAELGPQAFLDEWHKADSNFTEKVLMPVEYFATLELGVSPFKSRRICFQKASAVVLWGASPTLDLPITNYSLCLLRRTNFDTMGV